MGDPFVGHPVPSRFSWVKFPVLGFTGLWGWPCLAGAGKTFLTSKVIDHVQGLLENSSIPEGFAFFFCNRNEEDRRKPLSVPRSYVRQLSTTVRNHGTFGKGSETSTMKRDWTDQTSASVCAKNNCSSRWISGDRLVETTELLLSSSKSLRVFISSRPDADIRDRFLSQPNIEIQATDNQEDIKKFVHEEIVKHRR